MGSLRTVGIRASLGIVLLDLAHSTVLPIDTIRYISSTLIRKSGEHWRNSKATKRIRVGKKTAYWMCSCCNCFHYFMRFRLLYYLTFIGQDIVAMITAIKIKKIKNCFCHEVTSQPSAHVQ